jgi:cytochrome c oxidase assembly protein subunit 15
LVAVIVVQGGIGYAQYFLGVPAWLVLLHMAGSVVFWVTVLYVRFAARDRGPAPADSVELRPVRAPAI